MKKLLLGLFIAALVTAVAQTIITQDLAIVWNANPPVEQVKGYYVRLLDVDTSVEWRAFTTNTLIKVTDLNAALPMGRYMVAISATNVMGTGPETVLGPTLLGRLPSFVINPRFTNIITTIP